MVSLWSGFWHCWITLYPFYFEHGAHIFWRKGFFNAFTFHLLSQMRMQCNSSIKWRRFWGKNSSFSKSLACLKENWDRFHRIFFVLIKIFSNWIFFLYYTHAKRLVWHRREITGSIKLFSKFYFLFIFFNIFNQVISTEGTD